MVVHNVVCLPGCIIDITDSLTIEVDELIRICAGGSTAPKQWMQAARGGIPVEIVCPLHQPEVIAVKGVVCTGSVLEPVFSVPTVAQGAIACQVSCRVVVHAHNVVAAVLRSRSSFARNIL